MGREVDGIKDDCTTCFVPAKRETGGSCALIVLAAVGGVIGLIGVIAGGLAQII